MKTPKTMARIVGSLLWDVEEDVADGLRAGQSAGVSRIDPSERTQA